MILELTSGEKASVEIIRRKEAIEILSKPTYRRTWFGQKFRAPSRNHRGPGAAVDLVNYGLVINDKCRAVMRIGNAPWRNKPVIAAVGSDLAEMTAYLMRLWAAGISVNDLTSFIKQVNLQFPHDMMARHPDRPAYRYLLSLDNMAGWLIEDPQGGIFESPPLTGRIYHAAGALYAGVTKSQAQPTRYIDPETRQLKSVYNAGRNTITALRQQGMNFIDEGSKHRFVFVLAEEGSLQYAAYRAALPPWVSEFEWGERSLGWIQPRLFFAPWRKSLTRFLSLEPEPIQRLAQAVAKESSPARGQDAVDARRRSLFTLPGRQM